MVRLRAFLGRVRSRVACWQRYHVLSGPPPNESSGWLSVAAAGRQHDAFMALIKKARSGRARIDFIAAAQALELTGIDNPSVVEVGCGSAYYREVFELLYSRPFCYLGIDVSSAMVQLAHDTYGNIPLVVADARALPLPRAACDVVFSGGSLMHVVGTDTVIAESVRVARSWCIFHTVPIMLKGPTTWLRKDAYGAEVVEVIFNRSDLERSFVSAGLAIHEVLDSIPYDVSAVVGSPTTSLTYVCRKV